MKNAMWRLYHEYADKGSYNIRYRKLLRFRENFDEASIRHLLNDPEADTAMCMTAVAIAMHAKFLESAETDYHFGRTMGKLRIKLQAHGQYDKAKMVDTSFTHLLEATLPSSAGVMNLWRKLSRCIAMIPIYSPNDRRGVPRINFNLLETDLRAFLEDEHGVEISKMWGSEYWTPELRTMELVGEI